VTASTPLVRAVAQDTEHFRPQDFDLASGARTTAFVLVPLLIGLAVGSPDGGVIAALGTLNLFMVDAPGTPTTRPGILAGSVLANSVAFAAGTILSASPAVLEVPLVGVGVLICLLVGARGGRTQMGLIAAVLLVIAVGLPGGTATAAGVRWLLVVAGSAWGLLGLMLCRWVPEVTAWSPAIAPTPPPKYPGEGLARLGFPVIVSGAVSAALFLGLHLGLARDFWIMLTVLVALRPDLTSTFSFAVARILGTVVGASLAYVITLEVASVPILLVVLAAAVTLTFATRTVNYVFYASSLTLFVILLLNLAFSGGPSLALLRVIDTLLGGALAVTAGGVLWALYSPALRRSRTGGRRGSRGAGS
jgi:hypothetical protein